MITILCLPVIYSHSQVVLQVHTKEAINSITISLHGKMFAVYHETYHYMHSGS